jgi:hypothetical protein
MLKRRKRKRGGIGKRRKKPEPSDNKLTFDFLNIRGFNSKVRELNRVLDRDNVDFIGITNLKDTLNVTNEELYPSISTVLLILYTMPANTAKTERSFSVLRRLKTYLRTTMLQDRLTSLAANLQCLF